MPTLDYRIINVCEISGGEEKMTHLSKWGVWNNILYPFLLKYMAEKVVSASEICHISDDITSYFRNFKKKQPPYPPLAHTLHYHIRWKMG